MLNKFDGDNITKAEIENAIAEVYSAVNNLSITNIRTVSTGAVKSTNNLHLPNYIGVNHDTQTELSVFDNLLQKMTNRMK